MTKSRGVRIPNDTASPPSAPSEPALVRVGMYLRDDQAAVLDRLRTEHRAAGRRAVSASDIVRAALDVAGEHPAEWMTAIVDAAK